MTDVVYTKELVWTGSSLVRTPKSMVQRPSLWNKLEGIVKFAWKEDRKTGEPCVACP